MALVILPWTIRNLRSSGDLVLIDSNGAFNILVGAQPEARFVDKDDVWSYRFGRVSNEAYVELVAREPGRAQSLAMEAAVDHIRSRMSAGFSPSPGGKRATSGPWILFCSRHLRNRWYGALPGWIIPLVTLAAAGWFMVVVLAGFTGIAAGAPSPFRGPLLILLLALQYTCGLTPRRALQRCALPLEALLAIPAGALLAAPRETLMRLRTGLVPDPSRDPSGRSCHRVGNGLDQGYAIDARHDPERGSHYRFQMEEEPGSRPATRNDAR